MGEFKRELLPDSLPFFESRGQLLVGRGKWRTTGCQFHGGSASLRVNVESGAWACMSCLTKGGDVVAYAMQADGTDFLSTIKALGAYADDGREFHWRDRPRTLSPRDAMEVIVNELRLVWIVIADIRKGVIPDDDTWGRFLDHTCRIENLMQEFRK